MQQDNPSSASGPAPSRRDFIALAAAFTCTAALCPAARVLADAASGPVDIGTAADYNADGLTDKWAASDGFLVVRKDGQIYALTSRCTHRGGSLKIDPDNASQLKCPKHGARFALDGSVVKPPAKMPLPRLAITRDDKGHLLVDPSKTVEAGADEAKVKV